MVNQRRLALPNPHLTEVTEDFLYHLGLTTHDNLTDMFKDVKVGIHSFRTLQVFVIKVLPLHCVNLGTVFTVFNKVGSSDSSKIFISQHLPNLTFITHPPSS